MVMMSYKDVFTNMYKDVFTDMQVAESFIAMKGYVVIV